MRGLKITADTYYDRSLRSWVVILRDGDGYGIPNELTGEEASYFYTKHEARTFALEVME